MHPQAAGAPETCMRTLGHRSCLEFDQLCSLRIIMYEFHTQDNYLYSQGKFSVSAYDVHIPYTFRAFIAPMLPCLKHSHALLIVKAPPH